MQMSNLSERNAFVRFIAGTSMTAMGIAGYSRNPSCMRARGMIVLGAMKMAEGVFKYCPTKAFLQNNMQSTVKNMLSGQNPDMEKIIQDFAKIVSEGGKKTGGTQANSNSSSNSGQNATNLAGNNLVNDAVTAFASAVEDATSTSVTNTSTQQPSVNSSSSNKNSSDHKKPSHSTNSSHKNNSQSATNPS